MDCGCGGGTRLLSYMGREFEIQWSAFDFWPLPFTAGEDNNLKPEKTISWQPFAQMNSKYPLSSDNRIQRLKIHRFVDFCAKVRLKTFPQKSQWINIELYCMLFSRNWKLMILTRRRKITLTRILEGDIVEDERVVAVLVHPLPGPRKVNIVLLPGHGQVHAGVSHNLT